jgi:hypothetical protein
MWSKIGVYLFIDIDIASYALLLRPSGIPTSANASHSGTVTSPQKRVHFPKSFMVETIKVHLTKLLGAPSSEKRNSLTQRFSEDLGIPLGGVKKKQLPWTTLPKILSDRGWQLENWPSEVPLPGSGSQLCDDNKGINGLDKKLLLLLYEAVKSEDHPLKLSEIAHIPVATTRPISPAPTSETFAPGLTIRSDISSLTVRDRSCEDDAEGSQRANKRPRLMGD